MALPCICPRGCKPGHDRCGMKFAHPQTLFVSQHHPPFPGTSLLSEGACHALHGGYLSYVVPLGIWGKESLFPFNAPSSCWQSDAVSSDSFWLHGCIMALVVIKFSLKIRLILKSNFVLKSYNSYHFCRLNYFLHFGDKPIMYIWF